MLLLRRTKKKKFSELYQSSIQPEWKRAYFDYQTIRVVLSTFKVLSQHSIQAEFEFQFEKENKVYLATNTDAALLNSLRTYQHLFWIIFNQQFTKVNRFFEYKLFDLCHKWINIKLNSHMLK